MSGTLQDLFDRSVAREPERPAVIDPAHGRSISYADFARLSDGLAEDLSRFGAGNGDRVGVLAPKSIENVAGILATLRVGSAYVPVDATGPIHRATEIFSDCDVKMIVAQRNLAEDLRRSWSEDLSIHEFSARQELVDPGRELVVLVREADQPSPDQRLAYILYTSGSTGKPKGVTHTHQSARAFVEWCLEEFQPRSTDRFSSHAPFHFDLSILDLYVPLSCGAAVVLIGEEEGKNPLRLAQMIGDSGLSIWYSTPSVLRLLLEHGEPGRHAADSLRLVLFAGEVFAPGHLRRLQNVWPGRRYYNLYGPTETNVCTYYEIPREVPPDRKDPYPIGKAISGDQTLVVDDGRPVSPGEEGELLVTGGTVMAGYWNRPDLNAEVFYRDDEGREWYRTGDVVVENEEGDLVFRGRRDRMIKRRGFRVELGEIEAALYRHPSVGEAAVVSLPDESEGVQIRAFVSWRSNESPSTIALKSFCAENLPLYMVPDGFTFLEELPKTSTDKIDYVRMRSADGLS